MGSQMEYSMNTVTEEINVLAKEALKWIGTEVRRENREKQGESGRNNAWRLQFEKKEQ